MVNKNENLNCRVCGKTQDEAPWGEDGKCPNYDICDCCGVEVGYGDCTLKAIRMSRECWLASGAEWKYPNEKPADWSLEKQLGNIPKEFK
jgi:hypothetical protein